MARYAIDAPVAVRLAGDNLPVAAGHRLVAASSLRSRALSIVYRRVRAGAPDRPAALQLLDRITAMRIRLLGDRTSRAVAWRMAEQLGWDDTAVAEYVAVAHLQADAYVTLDAGLARQVRRLVTVAPFEDLLQS